MESENRLPELQELGPVLQQLFKEAKDTATFSDNDVPMVFVDDDDESIQDFIQEIHHSDIQSVEDIYESIEKDLQKFPVLQSVVAVRQDNAIVTCYGDFQLYVIEPENMQKTWQEIGQHHTEQELLRTLNTIQKTNFQDTNYAGLRHKEAWDALTAFQLPEEVLAHFDEALENSKNDSTPEIESAMNFIVDFAVSHGYAAATVKNTKIEIHTSVDEITSPIMLKEGTEIASIKDQKSGIEGTIWVSDGYESMMHFVDFQGEHYTDWDAFQKELQDAIRNDSDWKKNLGLKEGTNLQEGCFDLMFTDKEGNILIDDTVEVAGLTDAELEGRLKGSLTSAKALAAQKKTFDKGEIRNQMKEEAFTVEKAPATLDDLKEPQTRDKAVYALVDSLMKSGKSVDDIDEMFSQIKMSAISRAEEVARSAGKEETADKLR